MCSIAFFWPTGIYFPIYILRCTNGATASYVPCTVAEAITIRWYSGLIWAAPSKTRSIFTCRVCAHQCELSFVHGFMGFGFNLMEKWSHPTMGGGHFWSLKSGSPDMLTASTVCFFFSDRYVEAAVCLLFMNGRFHFQRHREGPLRNKADTPPIAGRRDNALYCWWNTQGEIWHRLWVPKWSKGEKNNREISPLAPICPNPTLQHECPGRIGRAAAYDPASLPQLCPLAA